MLDTLRKLVCDKAVLQPQPADHLPENKMRSCTPDSLWVRVIVNNRPDDPEGAIFFCRRD